MTSTTRLGSAVCVTAAPAPALLNIANHVDRGASRGASG
jgi:hypothetical protein